MRPVVLAVLLATAARAADPASGPAPDHRALAREVLTVWHLTEELPMIAQMARERIQYSAFGDPAQRSKVSAAVRSGFERAALVEVLVDRFAQELDPQRMRAVRELLDHPVFKKLTALQAGQEPAPAASLSPRNDAKRAAWLAILDPPSEGTSYLMTWLAYGGDAFGKKLLESRKDPAARTFELAAPAAREPGFVQQIARRQEEAYGRIDDAELEVYAKLGDSPVGRDLSRASFRAIQAAITAGMERTARAFTGHADATVRWKQGATPASPEPSASAAPR